MTASLTPLVGCRRQSAPVVAASRPTDIRIVEVHHRFEEFLYRTPYQFGGRSVDRVTLLDVDCRVRTGDGKEAHCEQLRLLPPILREYLSGRPPQ